MEHDAPSTRAWSMVGQRVALYSLSACPRLRWPEIVLRRTAPWAYTTAVGAEGGRCPLSLAARRLLHEHYCLAEGGDRFPLRLAPQHGRNQCRAREVSAYIFQPLLHFTCGRRNTFFSSILPYQTSQYHLLLFHLYHHLHNPSIFSLAFPFLSSSPSLSYQ